MTLAVTEMKYTLHIKCINRNNISTTVLWELVNVSVLLYNCTISYSKSLYCMHAHERMVME